MEPEGLELVASNGLLQPGVAWCESERSTLRGAVASTIHVRVAGRPAKAEGQVQLVLQEFLLQLRRNAPSVQAPTLAAGSGAVVVARVQRVVDLALNGGGLEFEAETLVLQLRPKVGRPSEGMPTRVRLREIIDAAGQSRASNAGGREGGTGLRRAGLVRIIARQHLRSVTDVGAEIEHDVAARDRHPLELRILASHHEEAVLLHVVELGQIVRLSSDIAKARAGRTLAREIPTRTDVQIEGSHVRDEHEAIDRRLVIVIVAIAGVVHHAEAEMVRHATESELAYGRGVFRPRAFDADTVLPPVDACARYFLGAVEEG